MSKDPLKSTGWDMLDAFQVQNKHLSKIWTAIDDAALQIAPYKPLDRSAAIEDFFELIDRDVSARYQSPRVKRVFNYWADLAAGKVPLYSDFDPAEIQTLLPNCMVVELSGEPLQVLYRLVGREVIRFTGLEFTGHYLHELQMDEFNLQAISQAYAAVRDSGKAGAGVATSLVDGEPKLKTEYLICPLRTGETIDHCIVVEDYFLSATTQISDLHAAQWRPVADM
jgi:hypothetical protein